MPTIFQICVEGNTGSTGRIAEEIGILTIQKGWKSYIAFGRFPRPSKSNLIRIGSDWDVFLHGIQTRLLDKHCLGSKIATKKLIKQIEEIKPDIIHLHHIHGYYININILFKFLANASIPVIWTFHDCWSITGHCAYFDLAGCDKWKTECENCPQKKEYPASYFIDRSTKNYYLKKKLFTSVKKMVVVPVSIWLENIVNESFMRDVSVQTIHNGIDTSVFRPQNNGCDTRMKYNINNRFMILGVANPWSKRKGLNDFIELSKLLVEGEIIVLVGLNDIQLKQLPNNIIGLTKTENRQKLIDLYSSADIFINPTWEDNFPTTNLESLACGTPVITYKTGGSIEAVSPETGFIVEKGDISKLVEIIRNVKKTGKQPFSGACRNRALNLYSKNDRFAEYVDLYEKVLKTNKPSNHSTNQPINQSTSSSDFLITSNPLNLSPSVQENKAIYNICSNCIMDTSDPNIIFDEKGHCDYCNNYYNNILPNWHLDEDGKKELMKIAEKIKNEGKGKDFDCIIGLSGGPDSSYVVYIAKEIMGLRPLLFHVDAGWNTQQAVSNIEKLVDGLGLDLYTEVINWEEMKDLQVAYLQSQTAEQDAPQDIAFFSGMYKFARKYKIKYVLTGANYSTECCREPEEWGAYPGIDKRLVNDIHGRFGKIPLKTFPIIDIFSYKIIYKYLFGMQIVKPLNYIPYIKKDAEKLLSERFGWEKFQHKHHESRFTRFYEDYWMPKKFGYEKRRAHFSSLILTGQMTREEALNRISKPEMSEEFLKQEFEYIANKLGLTVNELQKLFEGENKTYHDYKNKRYLIGLGARAMKVLGLEKRLFR